MNRFYSKTVRREYPGGVITISSLKEPTCNKPDASREVPTPSAKTCFFSPYSEQCVPNSTHFKA
jgi:hypothetical protein